MSAIYDVEATPGDYLYDQAIYAAAHPDNEQARRTLVATLRRIHGLGLGGDVRFVVTLNDGMSHIAIIDEKGDDT